MATSFYIDGKLGFALDTFLFLQIGLGILVFCILFIEYGHEMTDFYNEYKEQYNLYDKNNGVMVDQDK